MKNKMVKMLIAEALSLSMLFGTVTTSTNAQEEVISQQENLETVEEKGVNEGSEESNAEATVEGAEIEQSSEENTDEVQNEESEQVEEITETTEDENTGDENVEIEEDSEAPEDAMFDGTDNSEIDELEEAEDDEENVEEGNDWSKYENVDVTFVTCVEFTQEEAAEFEAALQTDLDEHLEQLQNDLLSTSNDSKADYLEECIETVSAMDASQVFEGEEHNILEIPMKGIEIGYDGIDDVTSSEGAVEVEGDKIEGLVDWCEGQELSVESNGDEIIVKNTITAEEFADGGLRMSENMAEGQKQVTDPVRRYDGRKKGQTRYKWGKGLCTSYCCYSTKKYPNIVHCNKCSKSATENITKKTKWLAGGSDCAKAIRLGALYVSNPIGNAIYAQNVVCVIESCQSISNNEGANIYCNWKKKSGPHWNCSWFTGIGHTESFHYHA